MKSWSRVYREMYLLPGRIGLTDLQGPIDRQSSEHSCDEDRQDRRDVWRKAHRKRRHRGGRNAEAILQLAEAQQPGRAVTGTPRRCTPFNQVCVGGTRFKLPQTYENLRHFLNEITSVIAILICTKARRRETRGYIFRRRLRVAQQFHL